MRGSKQAEEEEEASERRAIGKDAKGKRWLSREEGKKRAGGSPGGERERERESK